MKWKRGPKEEENKKENKRKRRKKKKQTVPLFANIRREISASPA